MSTLHRHKQCLDALAVLVYNIKNSLKKIHFGVLKWDMEKTYIEIVEY